MDGDGVRELFLAGEDFATEERTLYIYQPDGDRSFARIAVLTAVDNMIGFQGGTLARIGHDEQIRFCWALIGQLRVYVAKSPGVWTLESIIPDPASVYHTGVYAHDLNRNGRDEVDWISTARTIPSLVFERPTFPSDAPTDTRRQSPARLLISPSPCRTNARVFLDRDVAKHTAEWSAFDAAGRLVFRQSVVPSRHPAIWSLPAQRLRPGLYFLQATDPAGRAIATGRATVVR